MTFGIDLGNILQKELEVLRKLKELSYEKTDMIINSKIEELEETTKEEEALVNELGLLESEREKLLDTWGVATDTSISHIIDKIPEDNKELISIKDRMTEEAEELNTRNRLNNDLIRENLEWIDFNMNLITNVHSQPGYGRKPNEGSGNIIFDRKV